MRLLVLCLGPWLLSACDQQASYACTEEFRTITVEVVDAAERPVIGLAVESVNERTGAVLSPNPLGDGVSGALGRYTVASDADLDALHVEGDPVLFSASGEGVTASARFVIADDGCHVHKEDGPERILAETL